MELSEAVKEFGFEDEMEFHRLVASVDISSQAKLKMFKFWQVNDGTKGGLLVVISWCNNRR